MLYFQVARHTLCKSGLLPTLRLSHAASASLLLLRNIQLALSWLLLLMGGVKIGPPINLAT